MAIGMTIAPHITTEQLHTFTDNSHGTSTDFQRIQRELRQLQEDNGFNNEQVYILRKETDLQNTYRFSVMLQDSLFIGDSYSPPDNVADMYARAWEGTPQSTPMFTDDHGTFVAALIPLTNKAQCGGILELDRIWRMSLTHSSDILLRLLFMRSSFVWLVMGICVSQAKKRVDILLERLPFKKPTTNTESRSL